MKIQELLENMDHSKDSDAVPELKSTLIKHKSELKDSDEDTLYDKIDAMMTRIAKSHGISGQKLHDLWVKQYGEIPDEWIQHANEARFAKNVNMIFEEVSKALPATQQSLGLDTQPGAPRDMSKARQTTMFKRKEFKAPAAPKQLELPLETKKETAAKLKKEFKELIDGTPPGPVTDFEKKVHALLAKVPNEQMREALLKISKEGIRNTTTQTVIMSVLMAVVNRLIVKIGMSSGFSSFIITMLLETIIPFIASYLYSYFQGAGMKKSFKNAGIAAMLGGAATAGTVNMGENFADGKGPGRPGDSQRHGIPKKASMSELEKASHAKGRKGQLARWQMNMRRGKAKSGK